MKNAKLNRENLSRMIDFMKTVPEEHIKMSNFRDTDEPTIECKSAGCVIGWCTTLDKENIAKNFINDDNVIEFNLWIEEFLNLKSVYETGIWDFMFSGFWNDNKVFILNRMEYVYYKSLTMKNYELNTFLDDLMKTDSRENEFEFDDSEKSINKKILKELKEAKDAGKIK